MNNSPSAKAGKRPSLFWRLWFRSLVVRRPQAAVALVSLLAGAAIVSMLLNLYGDVQRKMTEEFRAYGANAVLGPRENASPTAASAPSLMDESALASLPSWQQKIKGLATVPVLYAVAQAERVPPRSPADESANLVVVGADFRSLRTVVGGWREQSLNERDDLDNQSCAVGAHVARRLGLHLGDSVRLSMIAQSSPGSGAGASATFRVVHIISAGSSEDDRVFLNLETLQRLASLNGKISLVQMIVPGNPGEVENNVRALRSAFPAFDVRAIPQVLYSQGKVLGTLRSLLISLTALIVLIIVLCVTATMIAIVLERRKDIAVMKALGAAEREVSNLFLAEGATLGLIAGITGFPLGVWLAQELARRIFGISLNVVWWTLPVICAATALLAVLGTFFPIGVIRRIQPATVLKGE
jgi:putative ABC transport system permease protein